VKKSAIVFIHLLIIITIKNRRRPHRHLARPVSHNHRTCVSQIHRPWVRKTRQNVYGAEVDPDNLEPWVTAVAWSDGAIQELQGVLHPDNEAKDDADGIRRMKQNKSRTINEQALDIAKFFRELKRYARFDLHA
jgi:hypothetical protein